MASNITSRDALTSRVIPQMKLGTPSTTPSSTNSSKASNTPDPDISRYSVHGNAAVTGGAGRLALEASRALLQHGLMGLVILDLPSSIDSSKAAIDILIKDFSHATILMIPMDVSDEKQVDEAFTATKESLGFIDMLLCFAGVVDTSPSLEVNAATFRRIMDINMTGTFLCAQAAAKLMVAQKRGGSILFTAS